MRVADIVARSLERLFSGQTVGTIAGARRLIRSAYSEAAVLSM